MYIFCVVFFCCFVMMEKVKGQRHPSRRLNSENKFSVRISKGTLYFLAKKVKCNIDFVFDSIGRWEWNFMAVSAVVICWYVDCRRSDTGAWRNSSEQRRFFFSFYQKPQTSQFILFVFIPAFSFSVLGFIVYRCVAYLSVVCNIFCCCLSSFFYGRHSWWIQTKTIYAINAKSTRRI